MAQLHSVAPLPVTELGPFLGLVSCLSFLSQLGEKFPAISGVRELANCGCECECSCVLGRTRAFMPIMHLTLYPGDIHMLSHPFQITNFNKHTPFLNVCLDGKICFDRTMDVFAAFLKLL